MSNFNRENKETPSAIIAREFLASGISVSEIEKSLPVRDLAGLVGGRIAIDEKRALQLST